MRKIILLLILFSLGDGQASAAKLTRVAILDFSAINVDATTAQAVRNIFEVSLYKAGNFEILERNKIERLMNKKGLRLTEFTKVSAIAKIGKMLLADIVITGSVNKLGNYTITARFVDVKQGDVKLADSVTAETEKDISEKIKFLALKMAQDFVLGKKPGQKDFEKTRDFSNKEKDKMNKNNIINKIVLKGAYMMPAGKFKNLLEPGFGATLNYMLNPGLPVNFFLGLEGGFFRLAGKQKNIEESIIVPLVFKAGYMFQIYNFIIQPVLGWGMCYNILVFDTKKAEAWESIALAGLGLGYSFSNNFFLVLGAQYGFIPEKDGYQEFLLFNYGFGIRF